MMTKNKLVKKAVGKKTICPRGQKDYVFGDRFRREVKPIKK